MRMRSKNDKSVTVSMKMNKLFVTILIIFIIPLLEAAKSDENDKLTVRKAIKFMTKADRELTRLASEASHAYWNWKTNITEFNRKIKENASKILSDYSKQTYLAAKEYPWKDYRRRNSTLYRWFELSSRGQISIDTSGLYDGKEEGANPYSKMAEIFGKVKVCPPEGSKGECTDDVKKIFVLSRDPKELKHYWLEFRKKTGEKYKDLFLEAIKKDNKDAKDLGYSNKAVLNIALYEDKDFVKNIAEQIRQILPFYQQIHAYVRKKLRKYYKNENITKDGPIPAHLLGDMYAQKWNNIFEIVKPYPNSSGFPNVTKAMNAKKMKEIDMFMMAEKFFTSLGMPQMTPRFWHQSMIEKPEGREVDCHASAHNFHDGKDYRIKMCTKVNTNDLEVVHHEMGHIEYYMLYNRLPFMFRKAANPGFHEAVGDAISLSVLTPSYLKQIGLLRDKEFRRNNEFTINYLMEMALRYVVTVPYTYIIDHWRNKVYGNIIKKTDFNNKYWQYRLQYQGVCPPSKRSEKHFDIGAKFHIAGGVEYFRYYVANILMFQIHKTLCRAAGYEVPLHECNIYSSKEAGKIFVDMLSQGRAKHWKQLLNTFSGEEFRKLDASAMLEYFRPLINWLKKKNAKEYIGWESDDPMSCPGDEEPIDSDATDTPDSIVTVFESKISEGTDMSSSDVTVSAVEISDATDTSDSDVIVFGTEISDEADTSDSDVPVSETVILEPDPSDSEITNSETEISDEADTSDSDTSEFTSI